VVNFRDPKAYGNVLSLINHPDPQVWIENRMMHPASCTLFGWMQVSIALSNQISNKMGFRCHVHIDNAKPRRRLRFRYRLVFVDESEVSLLSGKMCRGNGVYKVLMDQGEAQVSESMMGDVCSVSVPIQEQLLFTPRLKV